MYDRSWQCSNSFEPSTSGSGHEITQVFSRTEETAKVLAEKLNCPYTNNIQEILQAQLSIIAISDDAINAIFKLRGPVVIPQEQNH